MKQFRPEYSLHSLNHSVDCFITFCNVWFAIANIKMQVPQATTPKQPFSFL